MTADFDFAAWHRAFEARMAAHQQRLLDAFQAGKTVVEHMPGHDVTWPTNPPTFVTRLNGDPTYLADHLSNRHRCFGYENTIDGVRYYQGLPEGESAGSESQKDEAPCSSSR